MNPYLDTIKQISINNKYSKYYCEIITNALKRTQDRELLCEQFGYVESHHILPKSFKMGGEKDQENLVFLTAKEHFVAHLCLTKMFESLFKQKMVFAFRQLKSSNQYQERYFNSRLYEKIKPNRKLYIRLYLKDQIKYVFHEDGEEVNRLKNSGWSDQMTEEYKERGMCSMKGRKHSEETKRKMSLASKGKPRPYAVGRKRTDEEKRKALETRKANEKKDPERFQRLREKISKRNKEKYASGEWTNVGENNPMYGRTHSEKTRKLISQRNSGAMERMRVNDPERYQRVVEARAKKTRERWKYDKKLQEGASLKGSTAYQEYGLTQKEFYNTLIRPLIYLGLLPSAIIRYRLIKMCKGHLSSFLKKHASKEDLDKFQENKKNGAGANKNYIKFQNEQCEKLIREGWFEKIDSIKENAKKKL